MPRGFKTVSLDLMEHAEAIADDFERRGFRARVEHRELGFPYTPTLVCLRARTTVIVDVTGAVDLERVATWVRYCKSAGHDVQFAVCVATATELTQEEETRLQDAGVGIYVSDTTRILERLPPRDLAINVQLPDLATLPRQVREQVGSVYEKFGRGEWREGFGEACQVLETQARRHLKRGVKARRLTFQTKSGKSRSLTTRQIDKLTMGQLAEAFSQIQSKTKTDSVLEQVLGRVNKDRVHVTHHKGKAVTERRLRKNVGQHMWCVVEGLQELVSP